MTDTVQSPTRLPGWGVDADPRNDPTYPMRDRARDDSPGMNWSRPEQQASGIETLRSIEHNRQPAVFGESTPPRGLSGSLRRRAFRFSESQWAHWLMLMAADRIDVVEGLLEDFRRGKVPNVLGEHGMRAELQHNRAGLARKASGVLALSALGAVAYLAWRRRRA
jgi:hypothetical protein